MPFDTVYLTGASGFIGTNLEPLLQDNLACRVLRVGRSGADLDYEAFEEQDLAAGSAVIHLAGKAHDLRAADPTEYEAANVDLTRRLYDKFRQSEASVFIFVSSVKAVADEVHDVLCESDLPDPRTPYGITKLKAERYLQSHPPRPGQRVYVFRPCLVHGPGIKGNLLLLDHLVRKRVPYPLGAFSNRRSLLSIDNFSFAVLRALDGALAPGTYNLSDDTPLSTIEMVRILARARGRRPLVLNLPTSLMRTLARVGDRLRLPINTERLEKLTESYVVSNRKFLDALDITSMPTSTQQGWGRTVADLTRGTSRSCP